MNLLAETTDTLLENDIAASHVRWVGSRDGSLAMDWEQFAAIADVEYDNGYGGPEVAGDLVVVGDDWWLERYEYDGAERWLFKRLPVKSDGALPFKNAVNGTWSTLKELQEKSL